MSPDEASKLVVGDCLLWEENQDDQGVVTETGYCAVKIQWDNGQLGTIHFNDCEKVSRP